MAIVLNTDAMPPAALGAVRKEMARRLALHAEGTPGAEKPPLVVGFPHRVAYLPLSEIRRGRSLRAIAQFQSWRFLIQEPRRAAAAEADATAPPERHVAIASATAARSEDGDYRLAGVTEGPLVEGTEMAVRKAEELDAVHKGRFEPILLVAPAIYVAALWLQQRDGPDDIVLTIPPSNPALKAYEPMPASAFVDALAKIAAAGR